MKKSNLPESGVGGHSRGGVPFETPSDEVGEQGVLATWDMYIVIIDC